MSIIISSLVEDLVAAANPDLLPQSLLLARRRHMNQFPSTALRGSHAKNRRRRRREEPHAEVSCLLTCQHFWGLPRVWGVPPNLHARARAYKHTHGMSEKWI